MRRTPLAIAAATLALALPLTACGGDDEGSSPSTPSGARGNELVVHAKDSLKFDKTAYSAEAGTIDVSYINDGAIAHTLLVKEHDGFKLEVGGRDEGTLELEAGTYTLYCDIAGHEEAGMEAELTVS